MQWTLRDGVSALAAIHCGIYDPATTAPNPAGPDYIRDRNMIPPGRLDPASRS